ncbi:MAG: OmpA family protein [Deltaproteobacteria bacterium]|jgi:outer membrane protein OmpA-like peptidoglycan-associated protein|nr:MAG: OmpA family protein [Deltaproteobacteria bacterium]
MGKITKRLIGMAVVVCLGCASMGEKEQTGTAIGAGTGAVVGGVIGAATGSKNQREKAAAGAAAGAVIGGLLGNRIGAYMDKQEADLRNAMASTISQNNATIQRNNEQMLTATFKSDLFFDVNSSTIKPGGYAELDRVANVLAQYPQTMIRVEGHTDQTGSEQYNLQLSERRANAVKNALTQKGIDAARITPVGMGECCPVSSDNAANRRVSMVLTTNG